MGIVRGTLPKLFKHFVQKCSQFSSSHLQAKCWYDRHSFWAQFCTPSPVIPETGLEPIPHFKTILL